MNPLLEMDPALASLRELPKLVPSRELDAETLALLSAEQRPCGSPVKLSFAEGLLYVATVAGYSVFVAQNILAILFA